MDDNKVKIHGGRVLASEPKPAEPKSGISDIQPQAPMRSHAPGQTFNPSSHEADQPAETSAHEPVANPPLQDDPAAQSEAGGQPADSVQPTPAPAHHEPLHISKPKRSFGQFMLKTLLWLGMAIIIVLAGALGAIYFLKI